MSSFETMHFKVKSSYSGFIRCQSAPEMSTKIYRNVTNLNYYISFHYVIYIYTFGAFRQAAGALLSMLFFLDYDCSRGLQCLGLCCEDC